MKRSTPAAKLWLFLLPLLFASGCGGGGSVSSSTSVPPPPAPEVLTITTNSNVQCVQTVPFSLTLQAQGASSAIAWKILSGQLPSGLALDSSSGIISGTPTANSNSPVTIQAADAKATASSQFFFTVWAKLIINPVSPPAAHLGAPFSLSISGQGSSAIASWTISAGQLPPGLNLTPSPFNTNVVSISGTPSQTGTYSFTIQATDSTIPQTATLVLTIVVDSHLALSKSSLKNGGQNLPYSDSFSVVNGTPPYHWSVTGNFPAGLSVDSGSGVVSGTPSVFGGFNYSVAVSDSSSPAQSDSAQGLLSIAQQLQVVGSFSNAFIGLPYFQSLVAVGGTFPYTWTLSSGALPPGLSFFSQGSISGTPTLLGTYSFVLQVSDSGSPPYVLTVPVTLSVTPQPLADFGPPLSPAPVNVVYHSQIPASGGTPPYTWSLASGQLPLGLTLDSATGNIDGTPTQVGTLNFAARVTDSGNPPQVAAANDFIQIRPGLGRNDSIATASPLGNNGNSNTTFSISPYIDPINATTPNPDTDFYRLVAVGGSLVHVETFARRSFGIDPLDTVVEILSASGQRLQSCTPPSYSTACLNDDIDATTTDSSLDLRAPGPATAQTTFYLHVFDWRGDARPDMLYFLNISGVVDPLTISPTSLGVGATRGANYQQQFSTQGGTGTIIWSVGGGSLPPGWSLSSTGLLSGVATADGFYTFGIKATDSANPPQSAVTQYTLQIAEPIVITTPATWPNACLNKPYSFTVQTTGGIPPFDFGINSSAWVAVNDADHTSGVFSGTPDVLGTFTGLLGVSDSAQPPSASGQTVTLTVVACP